MDELTELDKEFFELIYKVNYDQAKKEHGDFFGDLFKDGEQVAKAASSLCRERESILKEEVERLKKERDEWQELCNTHQDQNFQLMELGQKDSAKIQELEQKNKELREVLTEIQRSFSGGDHFIIQYLPDRDSVYSPDWLSKVEKLLKQ